MARCEVTSSCCSPVCYLVSVFEMCRHDVDMLEEGTLGLRSVFCFFNDVLKFPLGISPW